MNKPLDKGIPLMVLIGIIMFLPGVVSLLTILGLALLVAITKKTEGG